jgi:hypothetical protein
MLQFYILTGFSLVSVSFLFMLLVQLLKIEKTIAELAELAEHNVRKIYGKE